MPIIDSNLILWDEAVSTKAGSAVALNALFAPGKAEPIPLRIMVTENLAGGTAVAVKLLQCDTIDGTYADVPGTSISTTAANFKKGTRIGPRFVPPEVTKPYIKLDMTVSGTATAGRLFAAIMREDGQDYAPGTYINAGKVVG